jgi:hypothetical protein
MTLVLSLTPVKHFPSSKMTQQLAGIKEISGVHGSDGGVIVNGRNRPREATARFECPADLMKERPVQVLAIQDKVECRRGQDEPRRLQVRDGGLDIWQIPQASDRPIRTVQRSDPPSLAREEDGMPPGATRNIECLARGEQSRSFHHHAIRGFVSLHDV